MEVYVDDILVKSLIAIKHVEHLEETFQILRRYHMRLNPLKCTFSSRFSKGERDFNGPRSAKRLSRS